MENNIEELTLLLMYLTSWNEEGFVPDNNGHPKEGIVKRCWKGYSFDIINILTDNHYLYQSKGKSVTLTPKGEELAQKLIEKYIEK